jgi:P27 family predicted phage terminase small subunit
MKRPPPPDYLGESAKVEWLRFAALLPADAITALDAEALAMYATARARWMEAERQIQESGEVVKSPTGFPIENPYLKIANTAMRQQHQLLVNFQKALKRLEKVKADKPRPMRLQHADEIEGVA